MDILNTIKNRRSTPKLKETPVDESIIQEMLEAATWAPNHHKTEPWKFFVLSGEGRKPLSRVLKEVAKGRVDDPNSEECQKYIEKIGLKPLLAPTIIVVAYSPSDNEKAIYIEDVCAVAAATQNMLLVAEEKGLGTIWRSGPIYNTPDVKQYFGLTDEEEILGLVFVGEKGTERKAERVPYEHKTTWIREDN